MITFLKSKYDNISVRGDNEVQLPLNQFLQLTIHVNEKDHCGMKYYQPLFFISPPPRGLPLINEQNGSLQAFVVLTDPKFMHDIIKILISTFEEQSAPPGSTNINVLVSTLVVNDMQNLQGKNNEEKLNYFNQKFPNAFAAQSLRSKQTHIISKLVDIMNQIVSETLKDFKQIQEQVERDAQNYRLYSRDDINKSIGKAITETTQEINNIASQIKSDVDTDKAMQYFEKLTEKERYQQLKKL